MSKWLGLWDSVPEVEINVIWACEVLSVAKYSFRREPHYLHGHYTECIEAYRNPEEAETEEAEHVEPVQAITLPNQKKKGHGPLVNITLW